MTVPGVIAAAIAEEFLFRGVIQGWIVRGLGGALLAVIVGVLT